MEQNKDKLTPFLYILLALLSVWFIYTEIYKSTSKKPPKPDLGRPGAQYQQEDLKRYQEQFQQQVNDLRRQQEQFDRQQEMLKKQQEAFKRQQKYLIGTR
jgi:thiaminase